MAQSWVSPPDGIRTVHMSDWDNIEHMHGDVGIIIVNSKHEGFAKELLALLNTMGLVEGLNDVAVIYHRRNHLTRRDFEELMDWDESQYQLPWDRSVRHRHLRLLYDASGIFDEQAAVKSGEIVEVTTGEGNKHSKRYMPELHLMKDSNLISDKRAADIRAALRHGACHVLFNQTLRDLTEYFFDAKYLRDAVTGISCGKLSLPITQADVDDYFGNPDETVSWGLDSIWALELCRSGAVTPKKRDIALMECIDKLDGMMRIWEHACASSKLPVKLAPRKDLDEIDVSMLSELAEMISMDSYLDAYLDGVPFEDITA